MCLTTLKIKVTHLKKGLVNDLYYVIALFLLIPQFLVAQTERQINKFKPMAFHRSILSSDEIHACSPQDIRLGSLNPYFNEASGEYQIQPEDIRHISQEDILIGFPIRALGERMAIGASLIQTKRNNVQRGSRDEATLEYRHLSKLQTRELKVKLLTPPSQTKGCVLIFTLCVHRFNCNERSYYKNVVLQVPILGTHSKSHALIFDPLELGVSLHETRWLYNIRPENRPHRRSNLGVSLKDITTSVVDLTDFMLIFDVNGTLRWNTSSPEMTSRWFLRFNLVGLEADFQSRPPVEGIGSLTNTNKIRQVKQREGLPERILRHRIFKDGQIKPIHYYVKNMPEELHLATERAFEYWQAIFRMLVFHPILSWTFLQGDFDGDIQVMTGDIRFNVLEWNASEYTTQPRIRRGYSSSFFDAYTGEIWSSSVIINGGRLFKDHQTWFEYSDLVRESMRLSQNPQRNRARLRQIDIQLKETWDLPSEIKLPLTPLDVTYDSYIAGFVENLVAHEIGHNLGFEHNYMASLFANNVSVAISKMDYLNKLARHRQTSNVYDLKAAAYHYLGRPPERTDMYCGPLDLINRFFEFGIENSPECIGYDFGRHPMENTLLEIRQIIDLMISRGTQESVPYLLWNSDLRGHLSNLLKSMASYYLLADAYYDRLQGLFINGQPPQNSQELKDHILNVFKSLTCDFRFVGILDQRALTGLQPTRSDQIRQQNLIRFLNFMQRQTLVLIDVSLSDLQCPSS